MKVIKTLAVVVFAAALFIACGGGGKPESVALGFTKAMQDFDFDGAKKYCTKETAALLDMGKTMMAADPTSVEKEKEKFKGAKVEVVDTKVAEDGNTATVNLKITTADGKVDDNPIELIKEDGNWKVAIKK